MAATQRIYTICLTDVSGSAANYTVIADNMFKAWQSAATQAGVPFDAAVLDLAANFKEPESFIKGQTIDAVVS